MDLKEIQNLIKFVAKSGASEVKLETEDLKITIRTGPLGREGETTYVQQIPMPAAMPAAPMSAAPLRPGCPPCRKQERGRRFQVHRYQVSHHWHLLPQAGP